jgi:hypothetical protein
MADLGIKKVIIKKQSLPPIDSESGGYVLRYRIISEDKNRTSQWSPIFITDAIPIASVEGALSITSSIITAVWDSPLGDIMRPYNLPISIPLYDVFVKFDSGSFFYHGTTFTHTYQFLNTGTTSVHVKVQVTSSIKELKAGLVIFDSGLESLV